MRGKAKISHFPEAETFRQKQKTLIDQGKIQEAFDLGAQDVQNKFQARYDAALKEAQIKLLELIKSTEKK
jgi:hypothetical protein